ncbi:ATP binding microtubule motor family protein [Wolffia australiana]
MYFTPNRRLGFSLPPSPSPFATPRSERRPSDCRWADGFSASNRSDRDKEVNVQVMVRCRPLSDEEQRANVQSVICCNEQRKEVTVVQSLGGRQQDKSFSFDKVFGPKAQQRSIFEHAISPMVNDALEGFNCTVFAYGQTGTGKTYTMEGDIRSKVGELSVEAGIIPRAVRQIFDTLDAQKADYSLKVTFLELYNEEIFDLLTPEDCPRSTDDKPRRPISLMEDGKGGAVIRGLEEVVVYSVTEIYSLLEQGSARRRTGETLLNKQSSRSHSIFSITVHVKEATTGNEELIKCGRLNLVDLAGSENISRSGARESRAREAGELNKSLLTLGRVITALVDHSGHVPYRDSKLTRFLRDSLGGKAKTCIISTISPSSHCLEETLNTLDYAYRAKGIKNKPEVNQKLSKSVLLKDLYMEIEKMKQDVKAAREKNGVYIPQERFLQEEAEKKVLKEKLERLEYDLDLTKKQADSFRELYNCEQEKNLDLDCEIKKQKENIEASMKALAHAQEAHRKVNLLLKEKDQTISKLRSSENAILNKARELHSNLEYASREINTLQSEIDDKSTIDAENHNLIINFRTKLDQGLRDLQENLCLCVSKEHGLLRDMDERLSLFVRRKFEAAQIMEAKIEKVKTIYSAGVDVMKEFARRLHDGASSNSEELASAIASERMAIENFLTTAASEAEEIACNIQTSLEEQKRLLVLSAQHREESLQRTLATSEAISRAANGFFDDLSSQASRFLMMVEETNAEISRKSKSFKKAFQESSIKEEKEALEKIAGILSGLRLRQLNMVSEAIDDVDMTCLHGKNNLEQEMSGMKNLSLNAKKCWLRNVNDLEILARKDERLATENIAAASKAVNDCSDRVAASAQQWRSILSSVDSLHEEFLAESQLLFERGLSRNQHDLQEFMSQTCSVDVEFHQGTVDLLSSVHDSIAMDHDAKKEIDPATIELSEKLTSLKDAHSHILAEIRTQTENCFSEEYQAPKLNGRGLEKVAISLPSIESIESLQAGLESVSEKGKEDKSLIDPPETPRNPFRTINE